MKDLKRHLQAFQQRHGYTR
jgi:hypothetical protein